MRCSVQSLTEFVSSVFERIGVPESEAEIIADVLVAADARGIPSHGVARLKRYIDGIRNGVMVPDSKPRIVHETTVSARIDGRDGLGQPVSFKAMKLAIEKAKANGIGMVTVFNSNHFGIAGYYAMMALEHGLIGFATTNTYPLVLPTFGRKAVLGTNPIALAVPTGTGRPFVLDMATSVVTRGKLEVYARKDKPIPPQWAADEDGNPCTEPSHILENFKKRAYGGLLPLGGGDELTGGHKGYGLAMIVEILSATLSGASISAKSYPSGRGSGIGHFFAAIDPELFLPREQFLKNMDELIETVKNSPRAHGKNRIYIHGEKEFEAMERSLREGIELDSKTSDMLKSIGEELGITCECD